MIACSNYRHDIDFVLHYLQHLYFDTALSTSEDVLAALEESRSNLQ